MPKILDLRFLSEDIIESRKDKDDKLKTFIVDRSNGKEHEIELHENKELQYNVDGNMKILNLQNIKLIQDIDRKLDNYTAFLFYKDQQFKSYILLVANSKDELYLDGKKIIKSELPNSPELDKLKNFEKIENIYGLKNLYNLQLYNEVLDDDTIMVIYNKLNAELNFNKEEEDLDLSNTKLKLLIQYNETNKEIEKLTNNKEKILEKAHRHEKILKARELVKQRVEFNKKWIHYLMTTSKVVHIILVIIIIVMIIYKVY